MYKGYWLGLYSVLFSSLYHPFLKFSLQSFNATQAALAEVVFTLIFCFLFQRYKSGGLKFQWNSTILLCGILNAVGLISFCIGLKLLSPVTVGLLGRTSILFSILLSVVILKEKITLPQAILIIVGFLGCFLFVFQDSKFSSAVGIALSLIYALFFAITNIITKVKLNHIPGNDLLLTSRAISLIFILIYAFFSGDLNWEILNPEALGWAGMASFFGIFVGFNLYYAGLKLTNLSVFTMIRSTSPLFVAIYSWPFFPVPLPNFKIFGGLLLFFSVLFLVAVDFKKMKKEVPIKLFQGKLEKV